MQFREYVQKQATAHQFLMYSKSNSKNSHSNTTLSAVHAPVALDLVKITRRNYLKALELQPIWNVLMQKLSLSNSFIDLMMEK